jgi:hypothetical protein
MRKGSQGLIIGLPTFNRRRCHSGMLSRPGQHPTHCGALGLLKGQHPDQRQHGCCATALQRFHNKQRVISRLTSEAPPRGSIDHEGEALNETIIETLRAMDTVRIVNPIPGGQRYTSGRRAAHLFAAGRASVTEELGFVSRFVSQSFPPYVIGETMERKARKRECLGVANEMRTMWTTRR